METERLHLTSATGIMALLDEDQTELKIFALRKLDLVVDVFWSEIAETVENIEILFEDSRFPERKLAALVASKVYYHLGGYKDSLMYALHAGDLFDINSKSEFVQTIVSKAIDDYTTLRQEICDRKPVKPVVIDPQLEAIVNRMFDRCIEDGQHRQAIGIALETRRMDVFERAVRHSRDWESLLQYSLRIAMTLTKNRAFRDKILRVLVTLYQDLRTPDYINMIQCLISLDDAAGAAQILQKLVRGSKANQLMAYQVSFDLYESAIQRFLMRVIAALRAAVSPKAGTSRSGDLEDELVAKPGELQKSGDEQIDKLIQILSGEITIELTLQFLIRSNNSDLLILKRNKDSIRNMICLAATVIANGLMHCGTTSDVFLRENLDWLARATNWAKFTAVSSLGVIHKGHEKDSLKLLGPYFPKENIATSGFMGGGALYALGLIHAHHGGAATEFLIKHLKEASNEVIRHGGCLGLGLAAMCTHREDIYNLLKANLYSDDAVTGEAAGIAMGLVMLGSGKPQVIDDMVAYAKDTQHEKILRGLAVGIAFLVVGRMEGADELIEVLANDKDPLLRRSAMHSIAMAYCGTENSASIKKLLHFAVSDVNDDVRRAAVEALGFLLIRTPEQCPSVVSLLSESFNPHVRYGSAMALGISCAGTGNKDALALLEPMTNDPLTFIRQGAMIASALVLVQQSEAVCPKMKEMRALYKKVILDKREDVMAKFGAILAEGIIDAGGRNVTAGLLSRTGHVNYPGAVGMLGFTQFWYWFPMAHFLSLAFTPSCVIGLNWQLAMPQIEYRSNVKPSVYAYPPPLEVKKEREREKVTTAVLSTTAKAAAKKKKKEKEKEQDKMDVDDTPVKSKEDTEAKAGEALEVREKEEAAAKNEEADAKTEAADAKKKAADANKEEAETKKEGADAKKGEADAKKKKSEAKKQGEKKSELNYEILCNPARVVRPQLKTIRMQEGSRYRPLKDLTIGGIVLMDDSQTEEPEQLVEPVSAGGLTVAPEEREAEPPEPFEYDP